MNKAQVENMNFAKGVIEGAAFDNAKSIEELAEENAKEKLNDNVEEYIEKLDKHSELLSEYKEKFVDDMKGIELKPMFEGILIKPFDINPFQQIKKSGSIIYDTGGLAPQYKSMEDGKFHEEEAYVKVGLVVDVGPTVTYVKEGDVVMWRKPSQLDIPFYKQGFVTVGEHAIVAVANEKLTERFNEINNGKR